MKMPVVMDTRYYIFKTHCCLFLPHSHFSLSMHCGKQLLGFQHSYKILPRGHTHHIEYFYSIFLSCLVPAIYKCSNIYIQNAEVGVLDSDSNYESHWRGLELDMDSDILDSNTVKFMSCVTRRIKVTKLNLDKTLINVSHSNSL